MLESIHRIGVCDGVVCLLATLACLLEVQRTAINEILFQRGLLNRLVTLISCNGDTPMLELSPSGLQHAIDALLKIASLTLQVRYCAYCTTKNLESTRGVNMENTKGCKYAKHKLWGRL